MKEFVEEQFWNVKAVALDSVIAVTGSARDAYATMSERTWPDTGPMLLASIREILNEGGEISRGKLNLLQIRIYRHSSCAYTGSY